jgi:hypothetical protein
MAWTGKYLGKKSTTAVAAYRFVAVSGSNTIKQSALATEPIVGSSSEVSCALGEMTDFTREGLPSITLGGNVTAGDRLTTDANGKAIATTTAGNYVGGIAMQSGIADDIIDYLPVYGKV